MKKTNRMVNGSMTVEASLVMPIVIFAIVGMMVLIQVMNLEQKIQYALVRTAWEASEYAYVYKNFENEGKTEEGSDKPKAVQNKGNSSGKETGEDETSLMSKLVDGTFFSVTMAKYLDGEELDKSCILGGRWGIHYFGSSFLNVEDEVEVVASYQIVIPIPLLSSQTFHIRQKAVSRGFVGSGWKDGGTKKEDEDGEDNKEETVVFVTATGQKYHKVRNCTYLQYKIHKVNVGEIDSYRNLSGAKYYPCESCVSAGSKAAVSEYYITDYGARYHCLLSCSKLKRTVYEVTKEKAEAEGKTPCSKCAAK